MPSKEAGWIGTRRYVDSQPFVESSSIKIKLPRIVMAGLGIRFSGTTAYNTLSAAAQPRAAARLLGTVTISGARKGNHKGINCPNVPAHMFQLRHQVLNGAAPAEVPITTTQGAFSLSLPILFFDPRLDDKAEQIAQFLDLTEYGDVYLTINTGKLLAAAADDDITALAGTATSATLTTPRVNVTAIEANTKPGVGYLDPDFEYFHDEQTVAKKMNSYTLDGKGAQCYDIIEGCSRVASTFIETPRNIIPDDGTSKIHLREGNKPFWEDFGPSVRDENLEFFTNLTATPTGLYIIDRCNRSLMGKINYENVESTIYLDLDNEAVPGGAVDLKVRVLHLTYNK